MRRVAVLVVSALVASLGVLVGSEAVVPPVPVAALPSEGVSVLAGTGTRGHADGSSTTAQFDAPKDVAISPDGAFLYVLDLGYAGRPNTIRKVDTATGAVTTFASGGLLANSPGRIEVDRAGNVWASITYADQDLRLLRFDSSGTPSTKVTGISNAGQLAFTFDPSGQNVYYANKRTTARTLHRLAIPGGTVDADAGTDLGGPGLSTRDDVGDFAWSPQGELYMSWGATVTQNAPGLYRLDGGTAFTLVADWVSQRHRFAFTATGGSLNVLHNDGTNDWLLRVGDFGAGPESIIAGHGQGDDTGADGQLHDPRAVAFSPDGAVAFIADETNFQVRQVLMPPDPWELSADQLCGPCNPGQRQLNVAKALHPVDVATGNLTESFTDLVLPGRGPVAAASRTYNSHFAATAGLFGLGWSTPLDMRLELYPGTVVVHQESGATLPFARLVDGSITAPARVTSTLEELPGGGWRLDRNHGDIVTFNSTGEVTGWEDRNGYTTTVTRPSGQIIMSTPGGRSLTFTVSSGRVTSVSDDSSPARTVNYTYTSGRLTKVETFKVNASDTGRVTWQYGYDTAGRLATVTNPRGNSNLTHYDTKGRVDYQLDFTGARSDIAYGGTYPDEWRTITYPAYNAAGNRAVVRYQLDGLLSASITTGYGTASARTINYAYDPDTLGVATVTGPGPSVQASYTYDANGNVLTASDATSRTTTYAYTDAANPTSPTTVTDPDGNVSTLSYDDAGNLESSSVPVRLPNGTLQGTAVTTFERSDPAHPEDVTAVIGPDQQGQPTPKKAEFAYRAGDGQVSWVENPENDRTAFSYDSRGFVASTVTPRGNATGTAGDYETIFAVNDFGMVQTITDPLGAVSSQRYDGNGNVTSVTDANNQTTTYTYDAADRPRIATRADGSQAETSYYPNGAARYQVNGLDDATGYVYDVHGAVFSATDPNGQTTGYRYDSLGRLSQRIDPGGTCPSSGCTAYGYNAGNQLTAVTYSDPATPDVTAITYDDLGRRSSLVRSAGATQTWAWDSQGQLRSSTDVNGRTTAYGWTLGGNLASITYPGQATPVSYTYDAADRMKTVTDWAGRVTSFGWTADSQWSSTTFPSGTSNVDTRTYDEAGRLASVEWKRSTTSLGKLTYARDPEGLLESETPTSSGTAFSTKTWGYDDLDQLDQVDSTSLALDDAGNLTRTEDGTFQVFDPAQQLCWTSPTATTGTCASPAGDATSYDYDDRGNRTAMDDPGPTSWTYGYDQENRMTSAVETGEAPISAMTADDAVAGDFDGDDSDDVFWYKPGTGQDWVSWGTERDGFGLDASPYSVNGTAYEPFTGDFDGDGHDDIFWYGPGTAGDSVWFWFNGGAGDYTTKAFTVTNAYTPIVGDFDGDDYSDVYWYATGTAVDYIWWGNATVDTTTGSFTSMSVSRGGTYEPIAGDFDFNGVDDIFWYQPGTGADDVSYGTGTRNSWVTPTTKPVINGTGWDLAVGDFDGDNKDDLFLYSTTGSQVWWGGAINTLGASGNTTWVTLATGHQIDGGDFDGDNKDDLLAYTPDTGADTVLWGATRTTFGTTGHTGLTPDPHTATYTYDADGLRTAKTVDGTNATFTWNTASGLPLLLSQHQGTVTTALVYGPGGTPLYEVTGTAVTYYHQDHQGSTRLTTGSTGSAVARYAYGAHGRLTTNTAPGTPSPVLGYTGQYSDEETGFVYLRARYLDPATGQFLSRDPRVARTREPYSYASTDPINNSDPSGLTTLVLPPVAVGGGAVIIGVIIAILILDAVDNTSGGPLDVLGDFVSGIGSGLAAIAGWCAEMISGDDGSDGSSSSEPTVEDKVTDILQGLEPGRTRPHRQVESEEELREVWGELTQGHDAVDSTYPGEFVPLGENWSVGWRDDSRSGGPTIDVMPPGEKPIKVHIK